MPATSALFLVGAAAISGLPPLNGFASELLVASGGLAARLVAGLVLLAMTLIMNAAAIFIA